MKFFILLPIVLILIFICAVYLKSPAGYYRGPTSDHFNGTLFFNPGHPQHKKSLIALFNWWFSRERQPWPSHVNNISYPPLIPVNKADEIQVTFINHSTFLIQTKNCNFLTDPIWSERASPFSWIGPKRVRAPGIAFEKLPKIDFVLISHNHYDHLDVKTLLKLNHQFHPIFIVPLGNKMFLNKQGIDNVIELDWWQSSLVNKVRIHLLPAQHWSARWTNDRYFTLWGSYGVEIENKKIYFAGDTGFSHNFNLVYERFGKPDLALLPIGSFLPRWFMKENHLDPEEAVKAHIALHAKHSIGMHFGTFQLSDEPIDSPVIHLKAALTQHRLTEHDFSVLHEGESKIFSD